MNKICIEALTEEELEKVLLIGQIIRYDDLNDYDLLVDYYISTGEVTFDVEYAKKYLADTEPLP